MNHKILSLITLSTVITLIGCKKMDGNDKLSLGLTAGAYLLDVIKVKPKEYVEAGVVRYESEGKTLQDYGISIQEAKDMQKYIMNNGHIDPHTIDKETLISYAQSLTTLKEKRSDIEISSLHNRSIANGIRWSDKNFLHSLAMSTSPESILDNNIQKRNEEIAREQKTIENRLERERQEKQKIAEKKRKAQEEANKPENKLKLVYQAYVDAKQCHKIRQGYAIMYINDSQMQMLKQYVRNIENHYKSVSTLDTDQLWKNASIEQQKRLNEDELLSHGIKYNDWTKWHCDTVLNGIIQHHNKLFSNQAAEKDF